MYHMVKAHYLVGKAPEYYSNCDFYERLSGIKNNCGMQTQATNSTDLSLSFIIAYLPQD